IRLKPAQTPLAGRGLVHHQSFPMNLAMTVGMEQHEVVYRVVTAVRTPEEMVDVPAFLERQRLTTRQAFPVLFQPQVTRRSPTQQGAGHLSGETLLEVQLPGRIVGIRRAADLHVTADAHGTGPAEKDGMNPTVLGCDQTVKRPAGVSAGEVFR